MSSYDEEEEDVLATEDIAALPDGFGLVDPADPEVDLEDNGIQDFILADDDELPVGGGDEESF